MRTSLEVITYRAEALVGRLPASTYGVYPNVKLVDFFRHSFTHLFEFFIHIRNFANTVLENFRDNLCDKINYPFTDDQQRILQLGKRGSQLRNIMLIEFLEQKKNKDQSFIFSHLMGLDTIDMVHLKREVATHKMVSIPVLVEGFTHSRSHVVNIKVRNHYGQYGVEFFDSRGYQLNHPTNINALKIVEALSWNLNLNYISCSIKRVQTDGHSCGVYVAWHATTHDILNPPEEINDFRKKMVQSLEGKYSVSNFKVADRSI